MADRDFFRVFVGGLSWDTTDRGLENAFRRFGKVLDATVMLDSDTGRPRGFGFVTFADENGMDDAIAEMHNRELDGRVISVKKAQPKVGSGDYDYGGGGYSNGGGRRGGYGGRGGGGGGGGGSDDCFKCGQPGHWARECPLSRGGDGGGRYTSRDRDRYEGGGGRSDRYGGGGGGYSGRYSDRDRGDRGDRYGRDRYGSSDRYGDGYYKSSRSSDYDSRSGGYADRDRYGSGGPTRREGSYRERSGPYDRPVGGRTSYDDRY